MSFDTSKTSFEVSGMAGISGLGRDIRFRGTKDFGKSVKELTISFHKNETKEQSKRGDTIAELLELTPNLVTLDLVFSGHLCSESPRITLGEKLETALCSLKSLEHFSHHAKTGLRTDFPRGTLAKLLSSWPKLRTLYISGDICSGGYDLSSDGDDSSSTGEDSKIPSVTCALESVTFERLMDYYGGLGPIFDGSAQSLLNFEAWSHSGNLDKVLRPVLPSIESIKIEGSNFSKDFIINELSNAPRLKYLTIKAEWELDNAALCEAFAEALGRDGSFPSLTKLIYPGKEKQPELVTAGKGRKNLSILASGRQTRVAGAERRASSNAYGRRLASGSRRWAPY